MPRSSQFAFAAMEPGLWTLGSDSIETQEISSVGLARRILDLDARVYPVEAHGHVGSAVQWAPVFEAYPDSWWALANAADDIVAYWRLAALKPVAFAQACAGLLDPFDIQPRDCETLAAPGSYDVYLVRACIDPAWRGITTRRLFADSFFDAAERLAQRRVLFGRIAAVAHSDEECRICEDLGLAYLHDAPDDGAIFGGVFAEALRRTPDLEETRGALAAAYGLGDDAPAAMRLT